MDIIEHIFNSYIDVEYYPNNGIIKINNLRTLLEITDKLKNIKDLKYKIIDEKTIQIIK